MSSARVILTLAFALAAPIEASTDTLVVLNKEEASAWLIDPEDGETLARLEVGEGPHEGAVSPDGRTAVVCNYGVRAGGGTLTVIDIPARKVIRTIDLSPYRSPHGIRYMPDGEHVLVTSERSEKLLLVDVTAGKVVSTIDSGGDSHMVDLAPGGRTAYATAIGGGLLGVIDLDGPGPPATVNTGQGTEALAAHPLKEHEAWVGNNSEHMVKIVDTKRLEVVQQIEVGLQPIRLAFTNDGKYVLASCILSGDLAVIDASSRSVVRRVKLSDVFLDEKDWKGKPVDEVRPLVQRVVREGARPIGVLPGPDGRYVYVANRGLDHVAVVDTASWEVVRRLPTGKGPDGMAYSRIE